MTTWSAFSTSTTPVVVAVLVTSWQLYRLITLVCDCKSGVLSDYAELQLRERWSKPPTVHIGCPFHRVTLSTLS